MELFQASQQWSTRPPDERFNSLQSLYDATKAYATIAKEKTVPWDYMRVEARDKDVVLVGKADVPAHLTHWSFGQLCAHVDAPANYLRSIGPTLAAQNLNYGLANRKSTGNDASLMFHSNGSLLLRSVTTEQYSRYWNYELAARLLELEQRGVGWEPARPDIRISLGNDEPALYASDHDMFCMMRNKQSVVREAGNGAGLQRGVIVSNSEVGAGALKMLRFLYREMCGNHIIWGASNVTEISVRHVGDVRSRFQHAELALKKYADESASEDEAIITQAQTKRLAMTKEEVLDLLFGKHLGISRKALENSYAAVIPEQDGDPRTVWGIVQGITRHSQTLPYADQRTQMDKAAGKLMEAVF